MLIIPTEHIYTKNSLDSQLLFESICSVRIVPRISLILNFSYDIVIWSATGMKWIEVKMRELGVTSNPNYKITFMLDSKAMISVFTDQYGVVLVKPLGVIWGKVSLFTSFSFCVFLELLRYFRCFSIPPYKIFYMNS